MGLFGPRVVACRKNEWTTLIWNFGSGYPKTFRVVLTRRNTPDASDYRGESIPELKGEFEEKRAFWIFPMAPLKGELRAEMSFHREWINAYYSVRIKPDADVDATID